MILTITRLFSTLLVASSLSSCGAFSDKTELVIQMYGVARAPEGASGDRDPQFQSYTVQSIVLNSAEGDVNLLSESETFKIVDRPQILLTRRSEDLVGRTFTGLTVTLSPRVVGGDNDSPKLSFTLDNPVLALTQVLSMEKNNDMNFAIKAVWANTIGSGSMSQPSFEIIAQ